MACTDCGGREHRTGSRADVDDSAWDGSAALSSCAKSDTSATCYAAICAGRKSGDAEKQSSWALPHHKHPGDAPNAAGVRNALARIDQTEGLTNKAAAQAHLEAHQKAIDADGDDENAKRLPGPRARDNLLRGLFRLPSERTVTFLREAVSGGGQSSGMPVMEGHFATFNQWTEIDSFWEGNFMESIAPGAFTKTFKENGASIRALFQHGRDPILGDKPLGPVEELDEDDIGAHYAVPLLDTGYNAEIIPGLRAGLYGASFRFSVVKEDVDNEPGTSAMNPNGIPQRVIREMRVFEFGPVTFPAYDSATAGLRMSLRGMPSLTDWWRSGVRAVPEANGQHMHSPAIPALDDGAGQSHSTPASRTTVPQRPMSREDFLVFLERRR